MPLRLLKSALVGLLAALVGPIVWMVVWSIAINVLMPGVGSIGFGALEILLLAVVCFALASAWMYQRLRSRRAGHS